MGDVYRAEHQLAGRTVAMKLLRRELAEDEDLTRRFFQEAQAANRIRHPNIVDVLDAGFSEHGPYVAMECLEGTSVSTALARVGRFETEGAVAVVLPVLSALDAAHKAGIVHRDMKPENVFLALRTGEVQVKILDFGIAKVESTSLGGSSPRTSTGVVFGTPDYLSPEQATGETQIDGRSDVFSVGIVLFELLTGRRPF
jgi:serine/threonine-protein kinase